MPADLFHIVVVVYGFEDGEGLAVHLNGVLSAETRTDQSTQYNELVGNEILIGDNWNTLYVDDLAIWLKELTQQDISALHSFGTQT